MRDIPKREFILTQPLSKVALKLCVPAVISMLFVGLNSFMDAVYVGQLVDKSSLAGVSMGATIVQMFIGIGSLIGVGAGTVVSIAIGEMKPHKLKGIVGNILSLALIFSLILFPLVWFFSQDLLKLMGASNQILSSGVIYLHTSLYGIFFYIYGIALNMMIRGEGRMKEATYITVIGLSVNMILTPVFITKFDLGVAGAAYATDIAMATYVFLGYIYLRKKYITFDTELFSLYYEKEIIRSILAAGLPLLIMSLFTLIQMFVIFNVIASYGSDNDMVFYSALMRIMALSIMPYMGLMLVSQPVTGVNFGAGEYVKIKEIYWYFTKLGFFLVLPLWVVIISFPQSVIGVILPDFNLASADIVDYRVFLFILPILAINYTALSVLPAIKEDKIASIIALSRQLFLFIPMMLILPMYVGVSGIYWGSAIIDVIITIWVLFTMRRAFIKVLNK